MRRQIKLISILTAMVVTLLSIIIFSGCGREETSDTTEEEKVIIAKVNSHEISVADLSREIYPQGRPESTEPNPELAKTILDELIERALILDWANDNEIETAEEEVEARLNIIKADYSEGNLDRYLRNQDIDIEYLKSQIQNDILVEKAIREKITTSVEVTDEEIENYYTTNSDSYVTATEYHILQIITTTQSDAESALTSINYGTSFEQVAAENSVSPDRYAGGDVGYITLDALPTEVAEALSTLPTGEISPVIPTEYGFFIIQLEEIREGGPVELEDVKLEITENIRNEKESIAYEKWVKGLYGGAKIEIDEAVLAEQ